MNLANETLKLESNLFNKELIFTHEIWSEDFEYFYSDLYNKDDVLIIILDRKTYYQDLI